MGNPKMDNREIELKYVLSGRKVYEDLEQRLKRLGGSHIETKEQTNYFFDANRWLEAHRSTLRLRQNRLTRSVKWLLTLKGPNQYESNQRFNGRMEVEKSINESQAIEIIDDPSKIYERVKTTLLSEGIPEKYFKMPRTAWTCLGMFENTRKVWQLSDLEESLELDYARFPGDKERFELEIEVASPERAIEVNRWALDFLLSDSELVEEKRGKARFFFETIGYVQPKKKKA